jgi:hypothetical protein
MKTMKQSYCIMREISSIHKMQYYITYSKIVSDFINTYMTWKELDESNWSHIL